RREKSEALRYMSYYKIDIGDLSIYDIVIDSEKWNQYQILDILRVAIDSLLGPE
ncbi:MAG: cytidylate kinase, partial [Methanosarcina sp.]